MTGFAILLIVGAFAVGALLYAKFASASHTVSDGLALLASVFYILAAIALILGGFTTLGVAAIAAYTFIGLGKLDRFTSRDIQQTING